MLASEAINILKMFSPNTEVELVFPDVIANDYKSPIKPLTEGQMASLPMNPDKAQDWNHNPSYKPFEWEGHP